MDYLGFIRAVESGRTPPVALLHGPEPLLIEDAVAAVTRALFPDPSLATLSREVLEAREAGAEGIVRSALTLPFLTPARLVVARGADTLPAKQAEALGAYCKAPNPSSVLLLLADDTVPAGHWLLRVLPPAAIVGVPRPAGRALLIWLRGRARSAGFELAEEAATLLVELAGEDLATHIGEVEKAALAGGPENRRVTVTEVRAVVGEHRLRDVFELTDALAARDLARALAVLASLLQAGEEPLKQAGQALSGTGQPLNEAGQPLSEAEQPLNEAGQSLNEVGQPLSRAGQPLSEAGQPLSQAGRPLNEAGQSLNEAGQPLNEAGQP
ncbi:MAG: DNA polymerase III subunit delta, partial [Candidatus Rokubacteria bacterium]|nr:DNA polymerase III subunit delta [Candidatus Rokubacteria bacterium]